MAWILTSNGYKALYIYISINMSINQELPVQNRYPEPRIRAARAPRAAKATALQGRTQAVPDTDTLI